MASSTEVHSSTLLLLCGKVVHVNLSFKNSTGWVSQEEDMLFDSILAARLAYAFVATEESRRTTRTYDTFLQAESTRWVQHASAAAVLNVAASMVCNKAKVTNNDAARGCVAQLKQTCTDWVGGELLATFQEVNLCSNATSTHPASSTWGEVRHKPNRSRATPMFVFFFVGAHDLLVRVCLRNAPPRLLIVCPHRSQCKQQFVRKNPQQQRNTPPLTLTTHLRVMEAAPVITHEAQAGVYWENGYYGEGWIFPPGGPPAVAAGCCTRCEAGFYRARPIIDDNVDSGEAHSTCPVCDVVELQHPHNLVKRVEWCPTIDGGAGDATSASDGAVAALVVVSYQDRDRDTDATTSAASAPVTFSKAHQTVGVVRVRTACAASVEVCPAERHVWVVTPLTRDARDALPTAQRDGIHKTPAAVWRSILAVREQLQDLVGAAAVLFPRVSARFAIDEEGHGVATAPTLFPMPWLGGQATACNALSNRLRREGDAMDEGDASDGATDETKSSEDELAVHFVDMDNPLATSWEEVTIMSTTVGALRRSVAWIVGEEYVYDAGRDDVKCCVLVGENGCLRGHHLAVDAVNTGNPRHNDVCGWVYEYKSMGDLK